MYRLTVNVKTNPAGGYVPMGEDGLQWDCAVKEGEKDGDRKGTVYRLRVQNQGSSAFQGVICAMVEAGYTESKFFLPAYMYNRNRGDCEQYLSYEERKGLFDFPKIGKGEHPMTALCHMVRGERLSHPVAMLYREGNLLGISGAPTMVRQDGQIQAKLESDYDRIYQFAGFGCERNPEGDRLLYTLGYEARPALYVCSTKPVENVPFEEGCLKLEPGERLEAEFTVYDIAGKDERVVNRVIREVYARYHQEPRRMMDRKKALSILAGAMERDAYEQSLQNYANLVSWNGEGKTFSTGTSTAWTGGFEVAVPALQASLALGEQGLMKQAQEAIQYMVDRSMNQDSGLPFDACEGTEWRVEGWWKNFLREPAHSSYVAGQAAYYVLRALEMLGEGAARHPDWLAYGERVISQLERTKDEAGEIPHLLSPKDGHALEYDSFSGCWGVAAQAMYIKLTGDTKWLASCEKSLYHYYEQFVKKEECYGTPHDTWKAVDSEGILAFIKAARLLHEVTGDRAVLELLTDGLEYEFSFKFCYNTPIGVNPLKKLGWSSSGGSVTSTCNPHIHPMSNIVADEICYAYRNTGDRYFLDRWKDTMYWGMQTFNTRDMEYDYGKAGWMNERFCYSQGLLTAYYEDGTPSSTWMVYLPWAAANIMESLSGEAADFLENQEL